MYSSRWDFCEQKSTHPMIYSTCTTTSTPTIAFVLISPVHTDKKKNKIHPTHLTLCLCLTLALALCPMLALFPMLVLCPVLTLCPMLTLCTTLALAPCPSFALLPVHIPSSFIRLYMARFGTLSLIWPYHYWHPYHIMHSCTLTHICTHTTLPLFSSLHTHIETVPHPLIVPSEPHRAFVVIEPNSSYFMITAAL